MLVYWLALLVSLALVQHGSCLSVCTRELTSESFSTTRMYSNRDPSIESMEATDSVADDLIPLDPQAASKFKIVTCMSTSCAKKRKVLNMDDLATFGAFYQRIQDGRAPSVQVEEGPCLGSCKHAPCVAIEHEDYEGTVSLEGMTPFEFENRVFHSVLTEGDADRVWSCVENAIEVMQEMDDDEEEIE